MTDDRRQMPELRRCELDNCLCGSTARMWPTGADHGNRFYASCDRDYCAAGSPPFDKREDASNWWNRAMSRASADAMREALRSHVICHWTTGPSDAEPFDECLHCEGRWISGGAEQHQSGCLAAVEGK